jgi:peptidoglycan/xylan/chitin deacetylase (PgdA/CDA1 family)
MTYLEKGVFIGELINNSNNDHVMSRIKKAGSVFFLVLFCSIIAVPAMGLAATSNLIQNPSMDVVDGDSPKYWFQGQWGDNTAVFTYPVDGHSSDKGASVEITKYSDGDAKWYFNEISIEPNKQYLFSDWSKSDVTTEIVVAYHLSDDSYQYDSLGTISGNNTWKSFSKSFYTPIGASSVTVFHLINKTGKLTVSTFSLTAEDTQLSQFSQGMVTFSFDDGFKSVYTNGIPILNKANIKSTQAIITTYFTEPGYMSLADVKAMAKKGHEIASHSRTHADLINISKAKAKTEIAGSYKDLVARGISPKTFVYPYGNSNSSVVSQVKNAGYTGARGVKSGYNSPNSDKYDLMDQHVTSDVKWETIKQWIDTAVDNKQWVILEMHKQDKNGGEYSNDPALLQTIVDYVGQKKIKTVTLGQGIQLLNK